MLLCLPLFDDAAMQKILPRRLVRLLQVRAENRPPRRAVTFVVGALALLIVFCSLVEMDERFGGSPPAVAQAVDRLVEPLHIVSSYGLFAVMTTERDEIVIEGSSDGVVWREYEFRYKPGDVARRSALEHPAPAAPGLADVVRRAREPAAPDVVLAFPPAAAGERARSDGAAWKRIPFPTSRPCMCARILRLQL